MYTKFRNYLSALKPKSMSFSTDRDIEKDGGNTKESPSVERTLPGSSLPKLAKYQLLVGINSPNTLRTSSTTFRPASNEGIYKRTVNEESKVRRQYHISNYVVNISGMAQIIVGAALTALGASNGPKAAVTVLGAANTIMAGLLTYLKGQGLPTRLEQYLHLLRTLREHIEEREREFLEPDCLLDVDEEIARVAKMYQEIRQTAEDNAPGTILPPRGAITSLLRKPDINRSDVPAPMGDRKPGSMLLEGYQDLASFRQHSGLAAERDEISHNLKEAAEGELKKAENEISHLKNLAKDTTEKLSSNDSSDKRRSMG